MFRKRPSYCAAFFPDSGLPSGFICGSTLRPSWPGHPRHPLKNRVDDVDLCMFRTVQFDRSRQLDHTSRGRNQGEAVGWPIGLQVLTRAAALAPSQRREEPTESGIADGWSLRRADVRLEPGRGCRGIATRDGELREPCRRPLHPQPSPDVAGLCCPPRSRWSLAARKTGRPSPPVRSGPDRVGAEGGYADGAARPRQRTGRRLRASRGG